MPEPPVQQGCSCANLLVPLMMLVGGMVGYVVGGAWWHVLLGIVLGVPGAFVLIVAALGIVALLEPRFKPPPPD